MADGTIRPPAEAMPLNKRKAAKAATRQKVLDAGKALFETVGYEAATIRAIAGRAGMSTGAVFANFKDKRDLYVAAYGHPPLTPEQGRDLLIQSRDAMARTCLAFGDPAAFGGTTVEQAALNDVRNAHNRVVAVIPHEGGRL